MHNKCSAAGFGNGANEIYQALVVVHIVYANTVFDGDRNGNRLLHSSYALGYQRWMRHQAGADHAVLYPVARAAAVEVDLAIAPALTNARAFGQFLWVAAAQLQSQRLFAGAVIQQSVFVAVQQGATGDHFAVKHGAAGEQAPKGAAIAGRPLHHGGQGEAAIK